MKKFTKRIAAMGATVMMAVSMMSVNASAKQWKLFFAPGAGGMNVSQNTFVFSSSSNVIHSIKDECTYCSNAMSSNGEYSHARFYTYGTKANGENVPGYNLGGSKYHYSTTSTLEYYPLSNPLPKNYKLYVVYKLEPASVYADIRGNVYAV